MAKFKDNREYYEVFDFSPSKMEKRVRYEVLYSIGVVVFLISLMVLPIVLTNLVRTWMRSQGVDGGTATVVLCAVCLGLYAAVAAFMFALADHKINVPSWLKLPSSLYKKKYYFNVPQAYKKVHIEDVNDGDALDGFYLDGAVCTEEEHFEQDRLSYIYNLLNDEYDLHGEDITLYKITPETFASHYTFHKIVPRRDIYVFSLAALGIDREEYRRLKAEEESNGHPLRIATMRCFADLVEYRSDYRRTTYAYRNEAQKFYEGRD